ncbi:hypothetical protein Tco_0772209 [Tanacetum coccineum]|uniref:Uncharacterized protein n=1 Tax=Tanacetum coccineum TaxID=301880 RepID=A0ABQ4ZL86_9ASTR
MIMTYGRHSKRVVGHSGGRRARQAGWLGHGPARLAEGELGGYLCGGGDQGGLRLLLLRLLTENEETLLWACFVDLEGRKGFGRHSWASCLIGRLRGVVIFRTIFDGVHGRKDGISERSRTIRVMYLKMRKGERVNNRGRALESREAGRTLAGSGDGGSGGLCGIVRRDWGRINIRVICGLVGKIKEGDENRGFWGIYGLREEIEWGGLKDPEGKVCKEKRAGGWEERRGEKESGGRRIVRRRMTVGGWEGAGEEVWWKRERIRGKKGFCPKDHYDWRGDKCRGRVREDVPLAERSSRGEYEGSVRWSGGERKGGEGGGVGRRGCLKRKARSGLRRKEIDRRKDLLRVGGFKGRENGIERRCRAMLRQRRKGERGGEEEEREGGRRRLWSVKWRGDSEVVNGSESERRRGGVKGKEQREVWSFLGEEGLLVQKVSGRGMGEKGIAKIISCLVSVRRKVEGEVELER